MVAPGQEKERVKLLSARKKVKFVEIVWIQSGLKEMDKVQRKQNKQWSTVNSNMYPRILM